MGSSGAIAWAGSCSSPGVFCSDTNFEVVKAGVSRSHSIGLHGRVLAYAGRGQEIHQTFLGTMS